MYDIEKIRRDFPILGVKINGRPNTFLDTAASAQKPQCVIDSMSRIYAESYANVHRGSYLLSEEITVEYEQARSKVADFSMPLPTMFLPAMRRNLLIWSLLPGDGNF